MRGISEERLRYLFTGDCGFDLEEMLKHECQELSPWMPIDENTPKDKRIIFFWPSQNGYKSVTAEAGFDHISGKFVNCLQDTIEDHLGSPTHWMLLPELPEPPK